MTTFIEGCVSGDVRPDEIDDFIDRWHEGDSNLELHQWLGLTWEEFGNIAVAPGALAHIVEIRRLVEPARIALTHAAARARGGVN